MSERSTWDEWLQALEPERRAAAVALRNTFAQLGAIEPGSWTHSEITEDIPQLATFIALRRLWAREIDSQNKPNMLTQPVAQRLLAAGADPRDVVQLARVTAYEAVFGVLYTLTGEHCDPDVEDSLPGWELIETSNGRATGRTLDGLHEVLLTMDPSGNDGSDLWL